MLSTRTLTGMAAAAAVAATVSWTSPASAFTCSASAVRGTVLGQSGLEPVVAGGGSGCKHDLASLDALPAPLGGIAGAQTDLSGPADDPAQQKASALSGLQDFSLGSLRGLPLDLPVPQIPSGLDALRIPLTTTGLRSVLPIDIPTVPAPSLDPVTSVLPSLPSGTTLPTSMVIDALPAVQALVPDRQLPDIPLAAVRSLRSTVAAQCLSGLPDLVGASTVDGLTGLGQDLASGEAVDKVVKVLDEQTIPLTGIDLSKVVLPAGLSFSDPVVGPVLEAAVKQVLAGLPPVVLPAALGSVQTTPAEQVKGDGTLEQRALRMTVSMAGQKVADLVMGIARVATDGLSCGKDAVAPATHGAGQSKAPVQPASQLAVSCAKASITLVNVIDQGDHVTLIGAADKKLVGKRVRIMQTWNGQRAATTKVGHSGFFRTTAPTPKRSVRYTSRARYLAIAGGEKSLPLKLHRRMRFSTTRAHGGKVTLTGRVFGPMSKDPVEIRQAVSCTKDVVVKRIHADRNGHWRVTLPAPKGTRAATYRATTFVRNDGSAKRFPTFTLPGYVSL